MSPKLRSPANSSEWEAYYQLRWSLLREPWGQALGSEKDDKEAEAIHVAAYDSTRDVVAVGRLHTDADNRGHVRYMAVASDCQRRGIGRMILNYLEARAVELGVDCVCLHARESALGFYEKSGYIIKGVGPTLFNEIRHVYMEKRLT